MKSETPQTNAAWDDSDPLKKLSDKDRREFAERIELELIAAEKNLADAQVDIAEEIKQGEIYKSRLLRHNFDIEKLIRKCVLVGDICDPQEVADNIREYFKTLSSPPDVQPDGPCITHTQIKCQTNEADASDGAAVPSRAAGGEDSKL